MNERYSQYDFHRYCDVVRSRHSIIETLHANYGYPPYWKRENGLESMCKTIIEQQVSLTSARAVFNRFKSICPAIDATAILSLNCTDFVRAGITRQKTSYLLSLAEKLQQDPEFFHHLEDDSDDIVYQKLIALKGIGPWTANVYMLVALNRMNRYPENDIALIRSISKEAFHGEPLDNQTARQFIEQFAPMRSIACCYYYQAYIVRKRTEFIP
ncbi:MAG TPA: hypothetical protein PLP14_01405 [Chitinophagaceae bacterium]|nr:hypothetical protein [Chitinophagaceae bacterium]